MHLTMGIYCSSNSHLCMMVESTLTVSDLHEDQEYHPLHPVLFIGQRYPISPNSTSHLLIPSQLAMQLPVPNTSIFLDRYLYTYLLFKFHPLTHLLFSPTLLSPFI